MEASGRTDSEQRTLCHALSEEGWELPVIDVSHPAFALELSTDALRELSEESARRLKASTRLPAFVSRLLLRGSVLTRDRDRPFVSGMTTYLQKLGPGNLGPWATAMDRRIATAIGPVCMRLRLQTMARTLAGALGPLLAARAGTLRLLSLGGGPAPDCLNALILLRRRQPALLAGRKARILVLDLDADGPAFGARALAALQVAGAPLHGLDATFERARYDWNDVANLGGSLDHLAAPDVVLVGSSEGGLFEYGSDEAILANLEVLRDRTPDDFVMVGSVLRDEHTADPNLLSMRRLTAMPFRLLGAGALAALVEPAGWAVEVVPDENPFYQVVRLRKTGRPSLP
ncbi:MAG: hypothetical protein MUF10_02700 [Thermoanaerobaculaceae bacterium]|nr:hypothetical protein [Thermoanaerobaculaceae bacterium]